MAVRIDAAAETLSRTTNLPPIATFTLMGWFRRVVDRNTFEPVLSLGGVSSGAYYEIGTRDPDQFFLYNGSDSVTGTTLSTGTWYHMALVVEGTGAGQAKAYLDGVLDITHAGNSSVTAGKFRVGLDLDDDWFNGRACALKLWDVALTAAEVAQEMHTIAPRRLLNLNAWYPVFPGERTKDYSGLGRDLTEEGTLADEDPPPVSWGAPALFLPFAAAGAPPFSLPPRRRPMRVHMTR